ncbi:MAG: DEAD/DEAH box helicase [Trueperaceae bacterium]|nr:DEAD/DEAH box helicase [Trueperaceae bacterium]
MSFETFQLDARVRAGVDAAGYVTPTSIQEQTVPAAVAGRDVLGLAQTGTGKTAAFVLPMLNRLIDGPRGRTRALVVAPTRELAEQIHAEITTLGKKTGLRSATVYGGVGKVPQVRALRGGADIIVACPGRLLDHLRHGDGSLAKVEVLVLDEADHMFDMGFLPDVRTIVKQVPSGAQRLLFSATMPAELRHLAADVLHDPVTVEIGHSAPAKTVEHALYPVEKQHKTRLLKHLLGSDDMRSALVFTRTKRGAKRLAEQLERDDFNATSLQGNLSQNKRQRALDGFRDGRHDVLVATDIASRGIDVTRVSHVINYDVPTTADAYTHRIGRTGRAERSGEAYTLVTHEDEKMIRDIERTLGTRLERVHLDGYGGHATPAAPTGSPGNGPGRNRGGGGARGAGNSSNHARGNRRGGSGRGRDPSGRRGTAPRNDKA